MVHFRCHLQNKVGDKPFRYCFNISRTNFDHSLFKQTILEYLLASWHSICECWAANFVPFIPQLSANAYKYTLWPISDWSALKPTLKPTAIKDVISDFLIIYPYSVSRIESAINSISSMVRFLTCPTINARIFLP